MSAGPGLFDRLRRVLALLADPRVPALPRLAVAAAVLYLLLPVDLVPDVVQPLVGFVDDFMMLWLSLRWLLKRDPDSPRPQPTPHVRVVPPEPPPSANTPRLPPNS